MKEALNNIIMLSGKKLYHKDTNSCPEMSMDKNF